MYRKTFCIVDETVLFCHALRVLAPARHNKTQQILALLFSPMVTLLITTPSSQSQMQPNQPGSLNLFSNTEGIAIFASNAVMISIYCPPIQRITRLAYNHDNIIHFAITVIAFLDLQSSISDHKPSIILYYIIISIQLLSSSNDELEETKQLSRGGNNICQRKCPCCAGVCMLRALVRPRAHGGGGLRM